MLSSAAVTVAGIRKAWNDIFAKLHKNQWTGIKQLGLKYGHVDIWLDLSSLGLLLTHGAEPFLRSSQLCSYSRISQHFAELEGSLPCPQEPSTGPYSEPDQSNSYHPILSL
jgi:hypothetical protein